MRAAYLLFVTACWTNSNAPATAPSPPTASEPAAPSSAFRVRSVKSTCARTVEGMSDKLRPEFRKTGIPDLAIDEIVLTAIESCRELEWSSELLACYDAISDITELNACQKLMSTEQSDDISRRMMEVVSRMGQIAPAGPGPGPGP